jgi:hypothetical protein
LSQFPCNRSQIYTQAIERNVTLLSYVHLTFLLEYYADNNDLEPLWQTGQRLSAFLTLNDRKNATSYWSEIDQIVCKVVNASPSELNAYKKVEKVRRTNLGMEGIKFWENKIKEYGSLPKKEAIRLLIKADKIETKIEQIRKAIERECIQ